VGDVGLSLSGVIAPEGFLLDCAEALEGAIPLAACAYENGIAGLEPSPTGALYVEAIVAVGCTRKRGTKL
jgi:hypothetical protein